MARTRSTAARGPLSFFADPSRLCRHRSAKKEEGRRSPLRSMAVVEAPASMTDEQLRARVVEWLRETLPPQWVEAVEAGDPEKLRQARELVDYDDWCARLGDAG